MPIVDVGMKLPSIYLDRADFAEGVTYRFSVLDTRAIATESHYIDLPARSIKGVYQCIQGACCAAFGRRRQTYNVPIYVYRDPTRTTEGEVQVWQMSVSQWKKFSDLAMQVDFKVYDITLTASKRGWGMDLSYSVVPDVQLRKYWTPEQREQLQQSVESFYQMGEASMVNPMTFNEWNQLLYDCGFDLQNMQWPGGQSPMVQGKARMAIGSAVAPGLPMAPSMGVLPPVPGMGPPPVRPAVAVAPGVAGGVVFQPPAPQAGAIPFQGGVTVGAVPVGGAPATVTVGAVPQAGVAPQVSPAGAVPQNSVPAGAVPQSAVVPQTGAVQAGSVVSPRAGVAFPGQVSSQTVQAQQSQGFGTVPGGVPLGTAPVIPQSQAVPVAGVDTAQVPVSVEANVIPGQQVITAEEMEQLLQ
jgi:hypothetical protein